MTAPVLARLGRWTKRLLTGVAVLLLVALAVGTIWEQIAWRRTLANHPAPGRLVDIGGRRMQIDCRGTGAPVVVFEAGLDVGGALSWSLVHDSIAQRTRACAYSRAGINWSDPSPAPHNAVTIATDLHALLGAAGEKPPYVMVGHSLGGPYIMSFTKRYGADVAGLVFVDASHPDQIKRLAAVLGRTPEASLWWLKAAASLSWTGLVRAASGLLKSDKMSPEGEAAMQGYLPRSLGQMLLEQESMDSTMAEAGSFRSLGDRPVVVLTSMKPMPATTIKAFKISQETANQFKQEWLKLHDEEASWSSRSRHESVADAGHYIQAERPDVVIRAVREVVDSVRVRTP
jgi:pimeloyl-ACP methyl ester carboxylesterase